MWTHLTKVILNPPPSLFGNRQENQRKPLMGSFVLSFITFCVAMLCSPMHAQTAGTGALQGTIQDPQGAAVPNATVTALNPLTGRSAAVKSSSSGSYDLLALPPAVYQVTVSASGFEKLVQEKVTVTALATATLNLALRVGTANETVTVSSEPPQLNTTNGTLETVIPSEIYNSLPVEMSGTPKSPLGFVTLTPGESAGGNNTIVLNGGPGESSAIYINGMPVTMPTLGGDRRQINDDTSLEAVDQFQVLTSGIPAYYTGQGVVNLVLKSGANTFHGSLYENVRNTVFDAAGYFATSTPVEHQNEFGGTISGPILRNRLFFIFTVDSFHYIQGSSPTYQSVPTLLERQGNFSQLSVPIYDPATTVCVGAKCTETAFAGNIIPPSRISPISQYLQNALPTPINTALQNNVLVGPNVGEDQNTYSGKFDYTLTKTNHIYYFGEYGAITDPVPPAVCAGKLPIPYAACRYALTYTQLHQIQDTQTFTPNLINVFSYQINRYNVQQMNATTSGNWATKAGITGIPAGYASEDFPPVAFAGANSPTGWGDICQCCAKHQYTDLQCVPGQPAMGARETRSHTRGPDYRLG